MEDNALKFDEVYKFLDYVNDKGVLNANTVTALHAACSKIDPFLKTTLERNIPWLKENLDEIYRRFGHKDQSLTPASLQTYKSRTLKAINLLEKWKTNPATWHQNLRTRKIRKKSSTDVSPIQKDSMAGNGVISLQTVETIEVSYPLRPNFNFIATLPQGLKLSEVKKIMSHLATFAEDFEPTGDWFMGKKIKQDEDCPF